MGNFHLNRIGVALDLTSKDQETLQYAGYLAGLFMPETLFALHIVPVWDIGDFFKVDIRNPFMPAAPALGKVYETLSEEMTSYAKYPEEKMKIDIQEGRPYQKLKQMVEKDRIQLLVLGQKTSSSGSGITSRRLARHIKNDLLFVPSIDHLPIRKILWAVDFSEHAYHAFSIAHHLREVIPEKEKIIGLHIIDIPPFQQYGERGIYEYAISSLPAAAKRRCENFMVKHQINQDEVDMSIHLSAGRNVAEDILTHAQKMEADIIFIGAVGHSGLENYFLGSVTESLLTQNDQIPIWVVR
jgi:nucleotide-binding universal stress UspA family protein